jgi:fructooligosaccharide transport system substrate-binding protein
MKKRSKFLSIVSLLLVLVVAFAGCGKSNNNSTTTTEDQGEVTLNMWVHVTDETDEGKIYKQRIDAFNEANVGKVKVNVEFIPRGGGGSGYEDKINTALTTGQLPDIITIDGPNTAAYAESGIITPITSFISEEAKADYVDSIIQQGTFNNELYTLGNMESTVALFYNKTMLEEAGIEPGTIENPWTWDDFYNAGKTLTEKLGAPALDLALNWTGEWKIYAYAPFVWSNGGDVISEDGLDAEGIFNSSENAEGFAFIKKLVDEGITTATPEENVFQSGKAALYLNGAWTIAGLEKDYPDLEWGVMPFPVSPTTKKLQVPTGSWTFGVTTNSKNAEASASVVEWMTNKDSAIAVSNGIGMLPGRKSAAAEMDIYTTEGPNKILMDQLLAGGHARPASVVYPVISRSFEEAIDAVVYGEEVQTTLDSKVQQIEREAERFK